jgi:hypothetical protein
MLLTMVHRCGKTHIAAFSGNSGEKLHENWTCPGIDHIPLLL